MKQLIISVYGLPRNSKKHRTRMYAVSRAEYEKIERQLLNSLVSSMFPMIEDPGHPFCGWIIKSVTIENMVDDDREDDYDEEEDDEEDDDEEDDDEDEY